MTATANIGEALMSRILTHTRGISEPEIMLYLRDSAREIIRAIAVMRDVAEFGEHGFPDEYLLPAAGKEFCRIYDLSVLIGSEKSFTREKLPERWKNYYEISSDGETGAWTPPTELIMALREYRPYRLCIEYVLTVRLDEEEFPKSIISQYYETIILKALMKMPRNYLADARRDYTKEYYKSIKMVQQRVESGGIFWVRSAPYWGDRATRVGSLGIGNYGLPIQ